jgi:hypothetical protein
MVSKIDARWKESSLIQASPQPVTAFLKPCHFTKDQAVVTARQEVSKEKSMVYSDISHKRVLVGRCWEAAQGN